jgi:hypothetical protein
MSSSVKIQPKLAKMQKFIFTCAEVNIGMLSTMESTNMKKEMTSALLGPNWVRSGCMMQR